MGLIIEKTVWRKLDNLVTTLHNQKYFGKKELAVKYVNEILEFIKSIPRQQKYLPETKDTEHGTVALKPTDVQAGTLPLTLTKLCG